MAEAERLADQSIELILVDRAAHGARRDTVKAYLLRRMTRMSNRQRMRGMLGLADDGVAQAPLVFATLPLASKLLLGQTRGLTPRQR